MMRQLHVQSAGKPTKFQQIQIQQPNYWVNSNNIRANVYSQHQQQRGVTSVDFVKAGVYPQHKNQLGRQMLSTHQLRARDEALGHLMNGGRTDPAIRKQKSMGLY
jgi:hypothetical protein